MLDLGLLLIRLVIGLSFMAHGAQKLFGWFGGYGIKGTGGWFESIGMKPGALLALLAGLAELGGGLLLALGLLTPVGGILIALTMVIAIVKVHGANGYWSTQNGFEYNLAILVLGVALALTGGGQYALDALIF
ncbi:DoxX family protein [Paenibacillus barcinonensis]|uniref:DoxX family protein n=2 Tax=Paenibacillus barcinonensis TaxID=198119 RepID=A0ABX6QE35_PAEBA|nr:DoxX family protein [Paenibacillus barcinonensis]QKS60110.1 DoxX family protein [Paenibacillus barcinonensis]